MIYLIYHPKTILVHRMHRSIGVKSYSSFIISCPPLRSKPLTFPWNLQSVHQAKSHLLHFSHMTPCHVSCNELLCPIHLWTISCVFWFKHMLVYLKLSLNYQKNHTRTFQWGDSNSTAMHVSLRTIWCCQIL